VPVELRHLRYFLAVAEELSFTRAARQLYVSQPALSQQIRSLERIVGTPLFHRGPGGVQLTAAGNALIKPARSALAAVGEGIQAVRAPVARTAMCCGSECSTAGSASSPGRS
jgi:LysR family cyn operon transcriptional activator